jgi:RNA polymerase sigma-70 factor (ECF subfamily)
MPTPDYERYRAYLTVLVRQQRRPGSPAKADPSGVVQQTLLDAHQAGDGFAGLASAQRLAWLRVALARNLADEQRRLLADRRDVRREQDLAGEVESSAAGLERWLAAGQSSPSQRADRDEQVLRLAAALTELPEAQRVAIEEHYFHGRPVAAIAADMGRTHAAVAGLLKRGLSQLRERLREPEG